MEKTIPWIFLGVGVLLLAIAVLTLVFKIRFLAGAVRTEGRVTGFDASTSYSDGRTTTLYHALVDFTARDGKKVSFRDSVGSSRSPYSEGDAVNVVYDPSKPEKASIESFTSLWFLSLIFGLVGLLFGGVGVTIFYFMKRAR